MRSLGGVGAGNGLGVGYLEVGDGLRVLVVSRVVRCRRMRMVRMGLGLHLIGEDRLELHLLVVLRDSLPDVLAVLGLDEVHELLGVLANDDGPEVASNVVPGDAVSVLVVHDGEAGLIVVLLKTLDGHADVELGVDGTFLLALEVVGLRLAGLSGEAPE